ncbi:MULTISPECIES: anaerobic glycerol-3-phosphate dehydrogenase subunit A [Caldilinea]|jgi:glycerol-3-phosphate dehydrogenase|uniref:Glycerol-3-phosphate dehydrogenase n=1 Tax=Caldilinea aerophila (strain DSM 14535 / JCM 11387 / NBRC 104270 / STL-6-O1) TaxID=926550 RepID=I0I0T0_CALAS|nr:MULTISPECIES: anaerobic glycerol-3-phosphate dehydrogenase subunit A [Caldilinea]MBO9391627.1 anaerobic glycerol-3-phosphate dehydrogenase subunit A [Caldilinea sp.]BAL98867.1 FAD dependent oxidoreductase family protein [Caldilinea aerophila DSM 14535 = NBRC 104270]GIV74549.1 MAG: glycerol-3-phosphate dehydrogenase [Caldilinea sp.]
MKRYSTDVLVIGGGSTGTGVAWDAALRGLRVILVEKRDLTHGTTGRYHGLLHSGGRYAVKDPQSAIECIEENRILRRTHTHCIEDTGGFFVVTPEDEGDYPDRFKAACAKVGIPCEEIPLKEAFRREPLLNPRISRVFEVPDASADSFLATHATAQAARQAGAQILVYHEVVDLLTEGGDGDRRVVGARVRDVVRGEEVHIDAAITVNASGAWAGKIAAMAGIPVNVIPGKGVMVAVNHRLVNTVINRCKMPSDGDILVPVHTVAIIGTTDERVADPEMLTIEPWEVDLMLQEGDKLVPGLSRSRILRAWAGVRPLYQEGYTGESRDATRALALLDHRQRDGVSGFLTITGGKWTTFRLMAEKTVDKVCEQLGINRPCLTATTPVPGAEQGYYWLGHRLHEVEEARLQGDLICECELVTRAMIEQATANNPTVTLDDLRRDVRLGMGPCQGGFCTFRAVGVLHELRLRTQEEAQTTGDANGEPPWNVAYMQSPRQAVQAKPAAPGLSHSPLDNPNLLLRDFLQERWRGLRPVLWGRQLKQERLDELIYLTIMNVDHLPNDGAASPLTAFWQFDTAPSAKEADQ